MEQDFYIFGSKSSVDYDVLVLVRRVPETYTAHEWCAEFEEKLAPTLHTKKININLGVIQDGVITAVFKGTPDEVNNSVFTTYSLHKQWHELKITRMVPRDVSQKILRAARIILSFLSRSQYRVIAKEALKGDFILKLNAIKSINFSDLSDLGNKNVTLIDFKKICAFQLGQAIGLLQGVELYTKEDIAINFPELKDFLNRVPGAQMKNLEFHKMRFVVHSELYVPNMTKLVE